MYKRTESSWAQEAYIKASNSDAGDRFGYRVALDNDTLAVGVYREDSNQTTITNDNSTASADNSNDASGAVYVYKRTGTSWMQEAYIKASNNDANDLFGHRVEQHGDAQPEGKPQHRFGVTHAAAHLRTARATAPRLLQQLYATAIRILSLNWTVQIPSGEGICAM